MNTFVTDPISKTELLSSGTADPDVPAMYNFGGLPFSSVATTIPTACFEATRCLSPAFTSSSFSQPCAHSRERGLTTISTRMSSR